MFMALGTDFFEGSSELNPHFQIPSQGHLNFLANCIFKKKKQNPFYILLN